MAKSKAAAPVADGPYMGPEDKTQDEAIAASKERVVKQNEALNRARGRGSAASGTSAAAPTGAEGATTPTATDVTTTTTSAATPTS